MVILISLGIVQAPAIGLYAPGTVKAPVIILVAAVCIIDMAYAGPFQGAPEKRGAEEVGPETESKGPSGRDHMDPEVVVLGPAVDFQVKSFPQIVPDQDMGLVFLQETCSTTPQ